MSQGNTNTSPETPAPKKPRKRRWWKVLLVLLVAFLLLVLLIPTIASTSPVRSFVLGKVNASLPGKLDVDSWSLGWFSGVKAGGVKFTDASGKELVSVAEVNTPITLTQVLRGNLHVGEIVVRGVKVNVEVPMGAAVTTATPKAGAAGGVSKPIVIPDVAGKVRVEDISGEITLAGANGKKAVVKIDGSTKVVADLPGGGAPATVEVLVAIQQAGGVGQVSISGTAGGIKAGTFDPNAITGKATLAVKGLDLATAGQIAQVSGTDLAVTGLLGGQVDVESRGQGQVAAKGELSAGPVELSMGKDHFQTKQLRIPVDAELTGGASSRAVVRQLAVLIDQAKAEMTGDLPMAAIDQLRAGQAVTSEGSANVVVTASDLPALMNSLHDTLGLQPDVKLTSGDLSAGVKVTTGKEGMVISAPLAVKNLAGEQGGRKIGPLQPITLDLGTRVTALPPTPADVHDLVLRFVSAFATFDAQAADLKSLKAQGSADLVAMKRDLGTIVDLSSIRGGQVRLSVASQSLGGDDFATDVRLQGQDVSMALPASAGAAAARQLEGASLLVTARTSFKAGELTMAEPARIELAGKLIEGNKTLLDESMQVVADVSADTTAKPKTVALKQFMLMAGKQSPLVQLKLPEGKTVLVKLDGKRGVTTDALFSLSADLGALERISAAMTPATQPAAPTLERGTFTGDVACSVAADGAAKAGVQNGVLEFALAAGKFADKLGVNLSAEVSGDDSAAKLAADIKGKLATAVLEASAKMKSTAAGGREVTDVTVSKLDAKTDFASVSLTKPVVVADVPSLMKVASGGQMPPGAEVSGELLVTADIAKTMAFAGPAAADAPVLGGTLSSRQVVSLKQNDVLAQLDTQLTDLTVTQNGKVVVTEPKLTLGGSLKISPASRTASMSDLKLASAGGLMSVSGSLAVSDLGAQNRIDKGHLEITPDWSKLWPVIYALMPPAQQAKIGEMVIQGNETTVVDVSGVYPAGQPFGKAIQTVKADGRVSLSRIDWRSKGLTASGVIPVALDQGILRFPNATPLNVNDGKVYLQTASIGLKSGMPRLTIPDGQKLAEKIQLNAVLVSSLGKYASVVFADPTKATGWVDVSVITCKGLPLSADMYNAADPGVAEFAINLGQLNIDGKGIGYLLGAMDVKAGQGQNAVTGEIKDGRVSIAKGHCLQKMDLQLGDKAFSIDGDMRLSDTVYMPLKVGVPSSMVSSMMSNLFHVQNAEKYLPARVTVQLTGPASSLKVDKATLQALANDIVKEKAASELGNLLGGNKKGAKAPAGQPNQPADVGDAAGKALQDLLGGKKKQ